MRAGREEVTAKLRSVDVLICETVRAVHDEKTPITRRTAAFLRTIAELLDAPADDTASLRSRIVHALADAGLTPQR